MNKILVGIIAATIIGSMAFMQPTEAQAGDCYTPPKGTLIAINSFDFRDYACHLIYHEFDPEFELPIPGCLSCPPDFSIFDQGIINEWRSLVLSDKLDTLSNDVNSISNGIFVIGGIIICLLVGVLALGAVNLARKR